MGSFILIEPRNEESKLIYDFFNLTSENADNHKARRREGESGVH
jgi:hypothetical protein